MTAFEFLKSLEHLPITHVGQDKTKFGRPSNSELWRWLKSKSIIINGKRPLPHDEITFPITQLIFFPNGIKRTTII